MLSSFSLQFFFFAKSCHSVPLTLVALFSTFSASGSSQNTGSKRGLCPKELASEKLCGVRRHG